MNGRFTKFMISFLSIIFIFGAFSLFVESRDENIKTKDSNNITHVKEAKKKGNILDPEAYIDKAKLLEEIKDKDCNDVLNIGEEYYLQKKYNEAEFVFHQMLKRYNSGNSDFECHNALYNLSYLYLLDGNFDDSYRYIKELYTIETHNKVPTDPAEKKKYDCAVKKIFVDKFNQVILMLPIKVEQFIYSDGFISEMDNMEAYINKYETDCSSGNSYDKELVADIRSSIKSDRERNRIGKLAINLAQEFFDGIGQFLANKDRKGLENYLQKYKFEKYGNHWESFFFYYEPFFNYNFTNIKFIIKGFSSGPYQYEYMPDYVYLFAVDTDIITEPFIKFEKPKPPKVVDGVIHIEVIIHNRPIYSNWGHFFMLYKDKLYLAKDGEDHRAIN